MNDSNGARGAIVRREEFAGAIEVQHTDTTNGALAAQAKASVEARWIVAMRQPRNLDMVRANFLKECKRPAFAAVAMYLLEFGGTQIEGPSIRFTEAAMQALGNIDAVAIPVYDDNTKRIVEVAVTDYERNISYRTQITVVKTVERRFLKKNQQPLATRTNSYGDLLYVVEASDTELAAKEGALISKAMRTNALRLIPGWMQEEGMRVVRDTLADSDAKDPDAARRTLLDAFTSLNVSPEDLTDYLGHDVGKVTPAELTELRKLYTALTDGRLTWVNVMEERRAMRGEVDDIAPPRATGAARARAAVANAQAPAPPAPAEAPRPDPTDAKPAPKGPSRSKSAKAKRQSEIDGLVLDTERSRKAAYNYIQYGDPANRVIAIGDGANEEQASTQIDLLTREVPPPPEDDDVPDFLA